MVSDISAGLERKNGEQELHPDKLHASTNLDRISHLVKQPPRNKVFISRSREHGGPGSDSLLVNNIIPLQVSF